ncbi:endonuclease [Pseudogracilibacillus sp. SE30717A]|uniref:endonuclease n=1 Tax=Pseudogracilibacillus sp. SE30717A TaxID=3098293 RepID=UPI00300DF962
MPYTAWENTSSSFKSKIIGKLLGDDCITKQQGRKPRFQFIHTAKDYSWSNYCYQKLKADIPLNPPFFRKTYDKRLVKGYSLAYQVQSKTCDTITYLRKQWYPSKRKVIPFSLLYEYFNEESLAWWYMDDGHLKIKNSTPKKIIISTESFTISEIDKLILFLKKKYHLKFTIDKQLRIILYDQIQIFYFLHLITPYLHQSMYRKSVLSCKNKEYIPERRTTIYLPNTIHIMKPTIEINLALSLLPKVIKKLKNETFFKKYNNLIHDNLNEPKSYQIVINDENMCNLTFLKQNTGLSFSQLTCLCFQ